MAIMEPIAIKAIKLKPDPDIKVAKFRIGKVPTLVLRPAGRVQAAADRLENQAQAAASESAQIATSYQASQTPSDVGLLWIHGGGYILGMKEMVYMSRALNLVKKHGVTVFSPGYRLAWYKPYPAAVEDCFRVLQFMDENREALGFRRLMVGGESAGGGLCAAVCMMARDRGIRVGFQMPLYPMLSNFDTESSRDNHGRVWNTRRNHLGWRVYLRRDARKNVSPYAAPARQTDYRDLPPCYTFVGDGEPFYAETLKYIANLRAAGVQADVDVYHSDLHAFDMLQPDDPVSRAAIERFEKRLEEVLVGEAGKTPADQWR